jgi:hypothetical protein
MGVVNSYEQSVLNMLSSNNGQCEELLDDTVSLLLAGTGIHRTFRQALADFVNRGSFYFITSTDYVAETTLTGLADFRVDLNRAGLSGSGSNIIEYVLAQETMHTVVPFGLVTHYQMADAAYATDLYMKIVPEGVAPLIRSLRRGDAADIYNVMLFKRIVGTACDPRPVR